MNQFEIQCVSKADLEECIEVIREAFGSVAKQFHITKENCPTNRAFIELVHLQEDFQKGNLMYALRSDEKMVGFMQLEQREAGCFTLKSVAVIPKHRHMGYGKALLDYAKAKVRQLNGSTIKIGIIEENTVLKEWYETNGFAHKGTKEFVHLPFTVGFMECAVDN